jgi:methionyl-tRNA formyltransferase
MAGDAVTAVNIMRMDAGLDTGPVYLGSDVPIPSAMTAGQLHNVLSKLGAELMVEALARLEAGQLEAVSQSSEGVTYATKIDKRETRIDFAKPAKDVANHIRGLSPYPGAWFEIDGAGKRERIKVLAALPVQGDGVAGTLLDGNLTIACAQGAIRVQQLQRAGKQPMAASDFLRGTRIAPGTRFV